jgi:hypothetical protein
VSRAQLSDGTTWPLPDLDNDDRPVSWLLTHAPEQMTRAEQLRAASIIHAYGYLLTETTRERRDMVVREMRAALTKDRT